MEEHFINHIKKQFNLQDLKLISLDDKFAFQDFKGEIIYTETLFTCDSVFLDLDLRELIELSKDENYLLSDNFSFLKNWYLITHEKYFKEQVELDKYGRIGINNLMTEFHSILKVPMADIIRTKFLEKLELSQEKQIRYYLTCDFDHLNIWDNWNFKDFIREIIYTTKDLKFRKLKETILSYLFSRKTRKYNYYLNQEMFCYNGKFQNIGFFITSEKDGFDGNFDYSNKIEKEYINEIKNKGVEVGLHTSFYTYDKPETIFEQQAKFQSIFDKKPTLNRHHYLRFIFPDYLEILEQIGIEKDFSIYFPENMLFRCGTSSRFVPWNAKENRPYNIELYPITIMDGTFSDYLQCSFEEAKKLSMEKIQLCLQYSSDIVLLWHNRSTYSNSNIKNNYHPQLIQFLIEELSNTK